MYLMIRNIFCTFDDFWCRGVALDKIVSYIQGYKRIFVRIYPVSCLFIGVKCFENYFNYTSFNNLQLTNLKLGE